MNNSKPPLCKDSRKTVNDQNSLNKGIENKAKYNDRSTKIFLGYIRGIMKRLEDLNFYESLWPFVTKNGTNQSETTVLLLSVQEKVDRLYDRVFRLLLNFHDEDIMNLKNYTEDDKKNLEEMLGEYKIMMEEILQKQTKLLESLKVKIHTGIISEQEIEEFNSFFDKEMLTIMKITDKMLDTMAGEELKSFKEDLKGVFQECNDEIKNSNDFFMEYIKKIAKNENLIKFKLPIISQISASLPRLDNTQLYNKTQKKLSAISSGKVKLSTFNIKKHFDTETMIGRANGAKVTYLGVLIAFLYYKWKTSK